MVNFLVNKDKSGLLIPAVVVESKTLYELKNMGPDAVEGLWYTIFGEDSGLKAGKTDDLIVEFEFIDNGDDQNHLQGAQLELEWTFTAEQTKGEKR